MSYYSILIEYPPPKTITKLQQKNCICKGRTLFST